jgi:hypothetical protein
MKWYVGGRAGDTVKTGRKVRLVWLQPCCSLVYSMFDTGTASNIVEAGCTEVGVAAALLFLAALVVP